MKILLVKKQTVNWEISSLELVGVSVAMTLQDGF